MRKISTLLLSLALVFALTACAKPAAKPADLVVFAAASLTETLTQIAEQYKQVAPDVTLTFNFDSSGTLKTQIQEGADCDIFLSAAQKQMNELDITSTPAVAIGETAAPDELDFILADTRVNLLENKVVLVVPQGNPAAVTSFEDISTDKVKLIALGNADVPVGQYSQEIFTYLGVWEQLNADRKITFGTNVKEVTAQVTEAAVDCGVVYATDAASAGLTVVAEAPANSHKPVVYPAAVLNITKNEDGAKAFLAYLQTDACTEVFEAAGFAIPD